MASFDGRYSFSSVPPTQQAPYAQMTAAQSSPPHSSAHMARGSQSFSAPNGHMQGGPQIYTAVYSGVAVYEMEVQDIAVMRRRSDSWLNATQILKVASVDKGKRTKILEKEIHQGVHEKVQGGYGRYQGTWISYDRGRQFCRQYGVEEVLRPLLEYDIHNDGAGSKNNNLDTPTKEQAMAANRKRFYNNAAVGERTASNLGANTFFQGISPTTSNAIAAMTKAAKYDGGRPSSSLQRKTPGLARQNSSRQFDSQGSGGGGMHASQGSFGSFGGGGDHNFGEPHAGNQYASQQYGAYHADEFGEPPRKRMRPESSHEMALDPALNDETPTEVNESFVQSQPLDFDAPTSIPPMLISHDAAMDVKRKALLGLFDERASNSDFLNHPVIQSLSGPDFDVPLDTSANTVLHWAATFGRPPILRALIEKGANMFQGNAANQTPLMSAVQVNNSYDLSTFPDLLEVLGPLIDVRDGMGRTVLHHIAVSSGIQGRSQSCRYYLESLLEYTVKQGGPSASQQQMSGSNGQASRKQPMTLSRFMNTVVNVQDRAGNTTLNLVARVGSRALVNQLEEVGADFNIANNMGFKPADFGFQPKNGMPTSQQSRIEHSSQDSIPMSQADQIRDEIVATTSTILKQTHDHYTAELTAKNNLIAAQNAELKQLAAEIEAERVKLAALQQRDKDRKDRQAKIQNHRRANNERRGRIDNLQRETAGLPEVRDFSFEEVGIKTEDADAAVEKMSAAEAQEMLKRLPSDAELTAMIAGHKANNGRLEELLSGLKAHSTELEGNYRKVVSLCTNVPEEEVDGMLGALLVAVATDKGSGTGENRVREFLHKHRAEGA